MKEAGIFVIRVYGIVLNAGNKVLITDEFQVGMQMTKFPGGGLDFGEGTIDCLRREFREECNGQEIKNIRHFYTTDYFQQALFYENAQLISIYYLIDFELPLQFEISEKPFNFSKKENGMQSFRWLSLTEAASNELSFPVDKIVFKKLIQR
jgi:8-oxo-dGTP diphosphatase